MAQPRTTTDDAGPPRRRASKRAAAIPTSPPTIAAAGSPAPSATPVTSGKRVPKGRAKPTGPRRTSTRIPTGPAAADAPDLGALRERLIATVRELYPQADLQPLGGAFDRAVAA